jgi:signal transduction histidine kinase
MIFLGLFVASVTIIFLILYFILFSQLEDLHTEEINHEVDFITRKYNRFDEASMIADLNEVLESHPGYNGVCLLENADGELLAGNLARWPEIELVPGEIRVFSYRDDPEGNEPDDLIRATVCPLPGNHRLLVGRNFSRTRDLKRLLHRNAGIGLLVTLLLGAAVASFMALGLSRRLERINRTTLEFLDAGLHIRVPLNGSGDEFDRLAINLNRMLARIEQLMESMEGVTDVIAHDLRRPLNRLKSRIEVGLLASEASEASEDCRSILVENMEDTQRLLSTFNSLLTIARVRSLSDRTDFQTVDLPGVLEEALEFYGPVAGEKGRAMAAEAPEPAQVWGNRDLLVQIIFNLVDNAIKFSPPEARITLSATRQASGCVATVRDDGPGIPADFRDRAFERFARLESGHEKPGQGLGLSLVKVVMDLHEGRVELVDGNPGLIARLEFPAPE